MNCTHNCNQGRTCTCSRWPDDNEPWDLIDELIDMAMTAFGYFCALVVICAALGFFLYR